MPLRDWALTRLPPWLLDAYGTAWARANGDVKDALAALLKERVAASMPVRPGVTSLAPYAPSGALEATGRDVLMPRAIGEPDAGYAARQADAFTIHAEGGTPRGALRALRAAGYPEAMLVIRSQRLYGLDADGELVVELLPAGSWCFEPQPQAFWSRYAVLFGPLNVPPAWRGPAYGCVIDYEATEASESNDGPTPTLSANFAPAADYTVEIEVLDVRPTAQTDDVDYRYRLGASEPWRTIQTNVQFTPETLLTTGGVDSGLRLELYNPGYYGVGDSYRWNVRVLYEALPPTEESAEMNLIRALTKEWSNAAAVFEGIIIVTVGGCWGYPEGTWGASETWGGDAVTKYHG